MGAMLPLEQQREGFYAMVAMISAYCSLLEHLFVLVLPDIDFDPTVEPVTQFIGSRILDKFDRVFDNKHDRIARKFRERLRQAIDTWRNPYAHGGFDKQHGSIYFHIPEVGLLPMIMSDVRSHPTFHLIPDRESSFDQVCALFDELDAWLRAGPIKHGMRWVESGLDVHFNLEFLAEFRTASAAGDATFQLFVERTNSAVDRATNMDW